MKVVRVTTYGEDRRLAQPQFRLVDGTESIGIIVFWKNMRPVPARIKPSPCVERKVSL